MPVHLSPPVGRRALLLAAGGSLLGVAQASGGPAAAGGAAPTTDPRLFGELCALADDLADPWMRVAALRELVWQAKAGSDPSALNNPIAQYERARAELDLAAEPSDGVLHTILDRLGLETVRSSIADPHIRRQFPPHEGDETPPLQVSAGLPVAAIVRLEGVLDGRMAPPGGHWIEATLLRAGVPVACARVRNLVVLGSPQPPGQREYRVRIRNLSASPLWVNVYPFQGKPIVQSGVCPR